MFGDILSALALIVLVYILLQDNSTLATIIKRSQSR